MTILSGLVMMMVSYFRRRMIWDWRREIGLENSNSFG